MTVNQTARTPRARTGRARNLHARQAILDAALALARDSPAPITADAVARCARVSKQTIYRWWPSVPEVLLDALLERAKQVESGGLTDSWDVRVEKFLQSTFAMIADNPEIRSALRMLMAEAQRSEDFAVSWRTGFIGPRRRALGELLDSGVSSVDVEPGRVDLVVDAVFGAMWYRLLVDHAPLDEEFAAKLSHLATVTLREESDNGSVPQTGKDLQSPVP